MKNLLRILTLLVTGLLAVHIIGCGADDEIEESEEALVNLVSIYPPAGTTISVNAVITVTFDGIPTDIVVSDGVVTGAGKTLAIAGPFTPGAFKLTVAWADGTQTLTYTIPVPDTEPPRIIGGTIQDGDFITFDAIDELNRFGRIEIEFSEQVSGNIEIKDKSGAKIIWLGEFEETKGILEVLKGYELLDGRTYVIVGKAVDAAGNSTEFKIA